MIRIGLALAAALTLTAQTPPPTTSAECANTGLATRTFLTSDAIPVKAPRNGVLSLAAVSDEASRERGLMCVVSVPTGRGMIFVFPGHDANRGFWMKNTLVALDMVYVTSKGLVSGVAANVPATPEGMPDEKIARREGVGRYVIELGAGDAARHGIKAGVKLQLPRLTAKE
ncbi:MAG: hypothetical protein NVS3B28_25270 [Candidatus Velthaea sp.]